MPEFVCKEIQWCSDHGHPFIVLHTNTHDRHLVVAISVEEAQTLAISPPQTVGVRVYGLVADLIERLDARLESVELMLDATHILRSRLHVVSHNGRFAIPAAFVDGVALARRGGARLWMTEAALEFAPGPYESPTAGHASSLPDAFRHLIDSLDMQGLGSDPSPDYWNP